MSLQAESPSRFAVPSKESTALYTSNCEIVNVFVEQFYPTEQTIHFLTRYDGKDTIFMIVPRIPDQQCALRTSLPIVFAVGTYADANDDLIWASPRNYETPPMLGASIDAAEQNSTGSLGWYVQDRTDPNRTYILTCAHPFATGDSDTEDGESERGGTSVRLTLEERQSRARHANAPLPAGTTILQPSARDLKYLVSELQTESASYEALTVDCREPKQDRLDATTKYQKYADEVNKKLSQLSTGTAGELGTLTTVYELDVVDKMPFDYCLIATHPQNVGKNQIGERPILSTSDLRTYSGKRTIMKAGRTTGYRWRVYCR